MSPAVRSLLEELSGLDISVRADGPHVLVDAPKGAMTDALRARIKAHRDELLAALTNDGLPRGVPCQVEGIALDAIEAGLFARAVERGELVIEMSMPCASPVPLAWERWCKANGRPHKVKGAAP